MSNHLKFLDRHFPGLQLYPLGPLFYKWSIGLRFELADPRDTQPELRLKQAVQRATDLFEAAYSSSDEGWLVAYTWPCTQSADDAFPQLLETMKKVSGSLSPELRYLRGDVEYEDYDDNRCIEYSLSPQPRTMPYKQLLEAIGGSDLGLHPQTSSQLFFINHSNPLVFHMYDDRGLDIIAPTTEPLVGLYSSYHHWLLDYDRNRMYKIFGD